MSDLLGWSLAISGALGLGWLVGETAWQYSVREGELKFKLFGLLTIQRIKLDQVQEACAIRFIDWILPSADKSKASYLWCERWGGYMLLFRGVALTLSSGKTILIAPRNRDKFIAVIEAARAKIAIRPTD